MFYLINRRGRIVLDSDVRNSDEILQTIKESCWSKARAKVKERFFYHNPGHGWFPR